jgi:hypothetical protein
MNGSGTMTRLYLLGFTNDLKGVVFAQRRNAKKPAFWVPIDGDFMKALAKLDRARKDRDVPRGGKRRRAAADGDRGQAEAPRPLPAVGRSQSTSKLPVSEIQQLLRRGRSAKNVADAAKVSLAWVERLAEPVMTERAGVVQLAQRARMPRPRLGVSGLPVGEAVQRNLEERRATPDTLDALVWDARAFHAGGWRVWLSFEHRGKRRRAEWELSKDRRHIRPRNRLGAQLGWWPPEQAEAPAPQAGAGPGTAEPELEDLEDEESKPPSARAAEPAPRKRRPRRKVSTTAKAKGRTRPSSRASGPLSRARSARRRRS